MIPLVRKRNSCHNNMPSYFDSGFDSIFNSFNNDRFVPAVNIKEDEKSYNIEMALAGLEKDDVKIEIQNDILIISSEVKTDKDDTADGYYRKEFEHKSFCKNFTIPQKVGIENISAKFKSGILLIDLPKSKEEVKTNRVVKIS